MKQNEIVIGCEYMARINKKWCRVRVTAKRTISANAYCKAKTVFDWVRVNPPADARTLRGSASAACMRSAPGPNQSRRDLSGEPAHDTAAGGEPVPGRGDLPTIPEDE